jgi:hypothetical protein
MRLSNKYDDFIEKLDQIHPRYDETIPFDFGDGPDDGSGL